MALRWIFWLCALAIAASAAWRYRDVLTAPAKPQPPPKPFVFDNGSARDIAPADAASAVVQAAPPRSGGLRKCVRGSETVYTDAACAKGFKEQAIATDRVNVLSAPPGAPAPKAAAAAPGASPGPQLLRDKLDLSGEARLREKAIERAVEAQGR
jgi:hypothetical protein